MANELEQLHFDVFGDLPVETRNEIKAELEQLDCAIKETVQAHINLGKHFARIGNIKESQRQFVYAKEIGGDKSWVN
ncbi:MAG: hypothetical protein HQK99_14540 [Nitrospirae bacterium]|nr:hypothetical protein [Nitrospirota bacterium]